MPTIKGFHMEDGKMTPETVAKMKAVGVEIGPGMLKGITGVTVNVKKEDKPVEKVEVKPKYTEKQLFDMKKDEQVKLLKELGISKIPNLEKDRVSKILESQ